VVESNWINLDVLLSFGRFFTLYFFWISLMGQFSQHLVVEHSTVRVDLRRAKEERLLFFEVELDVACRFESSEPLVLEGINFRDVKVSPEGYAFKYDGFRITLNMGLKVFFFFSSFFFFFFPFFFPLFSGWSAHDADGFVLCAEPLPRHHLLSRQRAGLLRV
jgi:hypothetical protein